MNEGVREGGTVKWRGKEREMGRLRWIEVN